MNTNRLIGYNTDGIWYMQALKDYDIDVIGKKMTIVGAGGAAVAIEIQAALDGVKEISIFNLRDKFWEVGLETQTNEKSMTMMRIWGMQRKDLCLKAFIDAVMYGFLSSCPGFALGYLLFLHFAGNKLQEDITLSLLSFSFQSLKVYLKVLILIVFIVSGANLYIDLKMTEKAFPATSARPLSAVHRSMACTPI